MIAKMSSTFMISQRKYLKKGSNFHFHRTENWYRDQIAASFHLKKTSVFKLFEAQFQETIRHCKLDKLCFRILRAFVKLNFLNKKALKSFLRFPVYLVALSHNREHERC